MSTTESVQHGMTDEEFAARAAAQEAEQAARRTRKRKPHTGPSRWRKNPTASTTASTAQPTTVTPQPITYEGKPPRQVPRVVRSTYRVAQGWIGPAQAFNALIVLGFALWLINKFHAWGLVSLKGLGLGLAFTVVELGLFSLVKRWLELSGKRQGMVNAALAVVVVMVALFVGVVVKFNDLLFSVALVFCVVVALADPIGFVNAKEVLQAERDKFNAWKRVKKAEIRRLERRASVKLDGLTRLHSALGVTQDRLAAERAELEIDNDAKVKKAVDLTSEKLVGAVKEILDVVQAEKDARDATSAARRTQEEYTKTFAQIREEVEETVRAEYEGRLESLRRQLSATAYIPPQQPAFDADAHPVVTQDGEEAHYGQSNPA